VPLAVLTCVAKAEFNLKLPVSVVRHGRRGFQVGCIIKRAPAGLTEASKSLKLVTT
jgi:hypothetical protein